MILIHVISLLIHIISLQPINDQDARQVRLVDGLIFETNILRVSPVKVMLVKYLFQRRLTGPRSACHKSFRLISIRMLMKIIVWGPKVNVKESNSARVLVGCKPLKTSFYAMLSVKLWKRMCVKK